MLTVVLEPSTEQRITECAQCQGMSEADLIRTLVEEGLDDLDDVRMAITRLDNSLRPLTSAQAHQAFGPED